MSCTSNKRILRPSSWKGILIDCRKYLKATGVLTPAFNESRDLSHCLLDFWSQLQVCILHWEETAEYVTSTVFVSWKSQMCPGFRQWPSKDGFKRQQKKSFFFVCLLIGCLTAVQCMVFNWEWKFKVPLSYLSWKRHFLFFNASLFSTKPWNKSLSTDTNVSLEWK